MKNHEISKKVENLILEGKDKAYQFYGKDSNIFEVSVLNKAINGYPLKNVVGCLGYSFSLNTRYAVCDNTLTEMIKRSFSPFGYIPDITFYTLPTIYTNLISNMANKKETQLIVDVGDDITEFMILENGFLQQIASAPIGFKDIKESVSNAFSIKLLSLLYILLGIFKNGTLISKSQSSRSLSNADAKRGICIFFAYLFKSKSSSLVISPNFFLPSPKKFTES